MREVKSVKVDNWGVFFLQKLQNFFNKTDYCDLTLQFQDNSQLKVHRLVLSACTDYFNVLLEQSCEVIDDILIMPRGLQADVIVPIVNFMYTGTLEFEIEMYGRLLKTARDMNMTVLLKLLEAHKRTVDTARNNQQQIRRGTAGGRRQFLASAALRTGTAYVSSERRAVPVSSHQLKTLQIKPITPSTSSTYHKSSNATEPASLVAKYPHTKTPVKGPSRFECNDESTYPPDSFEMFDSISYESKPLITANQVTKEEIEDYDNMIPSRDTSSTFEQLRKSYTGQKRPLSVSSFESPPEKKPNIEDVKEYAEQQRMRKQIAAEFDDDHEYDDVLDDEFHNDDDDEDYVPPGSVQRTLKKTAAATSAPPAQHQIVIKNERADSKPTIVVKDTVGSNVSHTKIISEVLKKYPHLVKNNKNIKLKIMAKTGSSQNQEQSIIIKQENDSGEYSTIATTQTAPQQQRQAGVSLLRTASTQVSTSKPQQPVQVPRTFRPQQLVSSSTVVRQDAQKQPLQQRQQQKPLQQKDQVAATVSTHIVTQKIPVTTNPTPRRIDSKTMHSLIAMGAENTTGPWLCLRCGVNGRPISIPSYRGFRRHLVNTHRERIDRRLCEHCGWRSRNDKELLHHLRVQHDILPPQGYDDFPACSFCPSIFLDKVGHEQHMKDEHPDKPLYQQQCMYCDGLFKDEGEIYNHMQSQHKAQAQNDGLIDYTDEEDNVYFAGEQAQPSSDNKIKILSSITISPKSSGVKAAAGKLGAEALSSVATGIAASLGLIDSADNQEIQYLEEGDFISGASTTSVSEPKFVNADGQIMELTAEQRDEIISQLQSQPEGGVVMVLNQESFNSSAEIKQEDLTSKAGEDMDVALLAEYDGGSTKKDAINEWQNEFQNSITKSEKKVPEKTEAAAVDDGTEKAAVKEADVDEAEANADADTKNETVNQDSDDDDDEESGEAKKVEDESEKIEKAKENLKLLTGDWSDDEEEEVETTATTSKSSTQKEEDGSATKPETDVKEETDGSESGQIIFETSTASNKDSAQDQDEEDGSGILHADEAETDATSTVEEETTADKTEESVVESTVPEDGSDEQKEEAEPEEATSDKEQLPESTDESNEKDKNDDSVVDDDEPMKDDENVTDKSMDESVATEKDETENGGTEKKEEPSGEHIRTLISEWGDEDEEED